MIISTKPIPLTPAERSKRSRDRKALSSQPKRKKMYGIWKGNDYIFYNFIFKSL